MIQTKTKEQLHAFWREKGSNDQKHVEVWKFKGQRIDFIVTELARTEARVAAEVAKVLGTDGQGVIVAVSSDSRWSTLKLANGAYHNFHSTSFHGGYWPRVGQRVETVFNDQGQLLAVHEKENS
jgi:hypothetical protein